jgi:hypothetical protein
MQGRFAGTVENRAGSAASNNKREPWIAWLSMTEWQFPDILRRAACPPPPALVLDLYCWPAAAPL